MIVTLSGITGTGKSFFKDVISKELKFKNMAIVTTRPIRESEVNGIDKEFVSDEEFDKLVKNNEVAINFEFIGAKYAYRKKHLESEENQVTEVHYSTIFEFKKFARNVFSIYIIPKDIERAKAELKNRNLLPEVVEQRLKEIEDHIKEYSKNKQLQSQFDYVFINDYTEDAKNRMVKLIKEKVQNMERN